MGVELFKIPGAGAILEFGQKWPLNRFFWSWWYKYTIFVFDAVKSLKNGLYGHLLIWCRCGK